MSSINSGETARTPLLAPGMPAAAFVTQFLAEPGTSRSASTRWSRRDASSSEHSARRRLAWSAPPLRRLPCSLRPTPAPPPAPAPPPTCLAQPRAGAAPVLQREAFDGVLLLQLQLESGRACQCAGAVQHEGSPGMSCAATALQQCWWFQGLAASAVTDYSPKQLVRVGRQAAASFRGNDRNSASAKIDCIYQTG